MTITPEVAIEINPTPEHAEALSRLSFKTDMIRYAAEQVPAPVTTARVRAWLAAYDVDVARSQASTVLNAWRRVRGLADTGEQPLLTPELMAELDAAAAERDPVYAEQAAPAVERESVSTDGRMSAATEVRTSAPAEQAEEGKARGTGPFYVVAFVASLISLDTSYRFFGERMHITDTIERWALCGIVELTLIACGYAMRHSVRRSSKPGPAQLVALALCGVAAFVAISLGGPIAGTVRATLGPVLALVALHLALGIEVNVKFRGERRGTWARIGRELRERILSRLGLDLDPNRDALTRTRQRAADRAARLAAGNVVMFRRSRLARAVRQSNAALDPCQRERLIAQLKAQKTIDELIKMKATSHWS